MDDDCDETKRRTRNLSEKKRRDQFNMLVSELSTLITSNNRKMDKSTILKSTITFLKNHNEVTVRSRAHDVHENWKPAFLTNEEFTYLLLEALEGFIMVLSACGKIYYASESVLTLLGHKTVDIVNKSIYDFTLEEDRQNLFNLLQRNASAVDQRPNSFNEKEMVRFQTHFRRGTLDVKKEVSYDMVQFYGYFRLNNEQADNREVVCCPQDVESRRLLVCIGRLYTPQLTRDVSLVDSSRNEFTSRHSLEWKFLFLDHRAPPIIGYLPFEVLGTSGYDYYHVDDLDKVVNCHEALMQKGELTSCHYRFLTKGQQWIWLQTRFYISYHQWNSKPEFVVCTHRVASFAEVLKTMKEEKDKSNENVSETKAIESNKEKDTHEDPIPPASPSYVSETGTDLYANSYQPIAKALESIVVTHKLSLQEVLAADELLSPVLATSSNTSSGDYLLDARSIDELLSSISLSKHDSLEKSLTNEAPLNKSPSVVPLPCKSTKKIALPLLSPSFTAETVSDCFGNSFQIVSQNNLTASSSPERSLLLSPLLSDCSDSNANSFSFFETSTISSVNNEALPSSSSVATFGNSTYTNTSSKPASVKSVSAASTTTVDVGQGAGSSASWSQAHMRYAAGGSDTASQSEESRSSQRNCELESNKPTGTSLAPQHGIGAQYLSPSTGFAVSGVPAPDNMVAVPAMPVHVTSERAEIEEQLQRKHEELQQLILRQQEELRHVKEQLILARLGMLHPIHPIVNVPNQLMAIGPPEEMQHQQRVTLQLGYTNAVVAGAAMIGYPHPVPALMQPPPLQLLPPPLHQPPQPLQPQPPPPSHPPHPPHPPQLQSSNQSHPTIPTHQSNATHPPHLSEPHQQMPQ